MEKTQQYSNKDFFDFEVKNGLTTDNPAYKNLHYNLAKKIMETYKPVSILEIGSGCGAFLEYLVNNGVLAIGIDQNEHERQYFINRNPEAENRYKLATLKQFTENTEVFSFFNVIVSIEVFEHITDDEIIPALKKLSRSCDWFYFSSTPHRTTEEFDTQWGHINIKSEEEWIELFKQCGFTLYNKPGTPTAWSLLFKSDTSQAKDPINHYPQARKEPEPFENHDKIINFLNDNYLEDGEQNKAILLKDVILLLEQITGNLIDINKIQ